VAVQLIPVGILTLFIPFLKESPTWLLKQGRDEDAVKVWSWIRNLPADHQYIAEDVAFVKTQIAKEREAITGGKASFSAFLKGATKEATMKGMRNRFALVFIMFMWQAWSGAAAINYFTSFPLSSPTQKILLTALTTDSPTIFTSIGLTDVTLWTGVYGLIKAGGSIIFFTWFIDAFGRKWPWIISSVACALCQYYLAGYIAMGKPSPNTVMSPSTVAGGKAATAFIMIFGAAW
jgi:hypothetical protein